MIAVGDSVRCHRAEPARGTWERYAGRVGTVANINRQRFDNGSPDYVEIGVRFSNGTVAYFRPVELVAANPVESDVKVPAAGATTGVGL